MHFVYTTTPQGRKIVLDQCSRCGGIWFDRWEVLAVDPKKVDEIDNFDLDRLQEPLEINPVQKCPRCGTILRRFRDPVLSREILIFRCSRCDGVWLNCGELKKYKRERERLKQKKPIDDRLDAVVKSLVKINMNTPKRTFLKSLLEILNSKVNYRPPWKGLFNL
jgi:Zn-finger nucleic acid-binding protein